MPQSGFCSDSKCDKEIKRLYECHCCSHLICLNHLNEHDEKEELNSLTQQLRTKTDSVRSSIENRLKIIERETIFIERERKFLEQANHLLDGRCYPITNIGKILEDFDQLIQSNCLQESIIKVEPDVTNCPSKNECSLKIVSLESKSSISLDLTQDSEIEHSAGPDQSISLNLSDDSLQDNEERVPYFRSLTGYCPLTFNGAYGLSQSKHSIHFCSSEKQRQVGLYHHLLNKHKLGSIHARRLIEAIAKNQDPMTTKLFDDNDDIINYSYRIECPFRKGIIHLFDCDKKKNIIQVPCKRQSIIAGSLRSHLKYSHHLSKTLATKLAQHYKDNRTINHRLQS